MRQEDPASFLWLDLSDAPEQIAARLRKGTITAEEAGLLRHWSEHGYAIIPGVIPAHLIAAALAEVDEVWNKRRHVSIDVLTDGSRTFVDKLDPSARKVPHKLNDLYLISDNARRIFLNEKIVRFAELVFGQAAIGCNSLTFEFGSQQPAHIDHVYMTPVHARRLIASWIALEDVRPEAGPLLLWPGSHRVAPYDFGGGRYHYKPELESNNTAYIAEQKERFAQSRFMARKGDVLLWHSFFIHGGGLIENPAATRRSMACHYYGRDSIPGDPPLIRDGSAWYVSKPIEDPV